MDIFRKDKDDDDNYDDKDDDDDDDNDDDDDDLKNLFENSNEITSESQKLVANYDQENYSSEEDVELIDLFEQLEEFT